MDLAELGSDLSLRVREAEEKIYGYSGQPLINWLAADLQDMLESVGFEHAAIAEQVQETNALVSADTIQRWFAMEPDRERPSYAQHLLRSMTAEEVAQVQALYERALTGQTVRWRTQIAFVVGQKAP